MPDPDPELELEPDRVTVRTEPEPDRATVRTEPVLLDERVGKGLALHPAAPIAMAAAKRTRPVLQPAAAALPQAGAGRVGLRAARTASAGSAMAFIGSGR